MNKKQLLDEILGMLRTVMEDREKLEMIHNFFTKEIYNEEEEIEIPEKYKKLVHDFAEMLDAGHICYLNTKTGEHIEIYHEFEDYYEEDENPFQKDFDKIDSWESKIVIRPLQSSESFKIMNSFAEKMHDKKFQNTLVNVLNRKRPFANFKHIVDNSDHRQDWFDYKHSWYEQVVFEWLTQEGYVKNNQ